MPFIILSTLAAWFGMNDLASAKASFKDQAVIFSRKHNWIMCILYLGTFGSFIGFAAGFPLLIKSQFTGIDPVKYAFLEMLSLKRSSLATNRTIQSFMISQPKPKPDRRLPLSVRRVLVRLCRRKSVV